MIGAVAASGCGNLRAISAGQIGCPENQIKISQEKDSWGTSTWTAECRGRRFFCSAVSTGKDSSQINCKEESGSGSASTKSRKSAPSGGCHYDTQCKGDRICVHGECTSPPEKKTQAPAPEPAKEQPAQPDAGQPEPGADGGS